MKRGIVVLLSILWCAGLGFTQDSVDIDSLILQGKEQIKEAIDAWNVQQMMGARAFFERMLNDLSYPWLIHYYIGFVDLRISNCYLSEENKDEAKGFVDDGIEHLEKAVELKEDFAEGYALLSSLFGNKIGLNPISGITLGPKSGRMIGRAFELSPTNPRVSLIAGQSAYYTPKMFGGGKDKAERHLQKAIEYFDTFIPEKPIYPTWGHEDAHTYLGLIQMDREDFQGAKQSFEKALEINPNNGWVKFDLMKQLEEKMAKRVKE